MAGDVTPTVAVERFFSMTSRVRRSAATGMAMEKVDVEKDSRGFPEKKKEIVDRMCKLWEDSINVDKLLQKRIFFFNLIFHLVGDCR